MGPLPEEPAAAFLLGGMALLFWALGWDSAIRSSGDRVSVTNVLVTSTVAWTDVDRVSLDDDGLAIALRDERILDSVAFGGSLLGAFTGYRSHRRACRLLQEAHRAALRTQGGRGEGRVRLERSFEWRRLLCAATVVYGPVVTVWALTG
jgi:hypothetical protein